jgi:hypothetical protein
MREIVTAICLGLGRPLPRLGVPQSILKAASAIVGVLGDPGQLRQQFEKFIRDDVYSGSKFEAAYDFRPDVCLAEGIRREVIYLRSQSEWSSGRAQSVR